ncbi:MAG: hypothetical protein IPG71_00045 [bacterium]|nr:hypothetical protein [bacterium]
MLKSHLVMFVLLALSLVAFAQPAVTIEDLFIGAETALALAKTDGTSLLSPRRVTKAENLCMKRVNK